MISIIIPIYRAESYLHRCIDSILAQTNTEWELLLIDDGSPDKSGDICDEYSKKDPRIKVFHKSNGGVSSARNLGLDKARGQWITFVDADDYVDSSFCIIDDEEKNDIIIKPHFIVGVDDSIKEQKQFDFASSITNIDEFLSKNLDAAIFKTPWGKFFKSNILKNIRFPLGQRIGEDTAFMFTVLSETKKIVLNSKGGYYWQKGETPRSLKYKLSCEESIRFLSGLYKKYEQVNIECSRMELFLIAYFFDLIDKREPWKIKAYFDSPIISKYYRKLDDKGQLPLSIKLWKQMPIFCGFCFRLRAFLKLDFIHLS